METHLERALDDCLEALRSGSSVEQCLQRYPRLAKDLEPLLRAAAALKHLPAPTPNPQAIRTALVRMGEALPRRTRRSAARAHSGAGRRTSVPRLVPVLAGALTLVVVMSGWGMTAASARSQPGDFLYPLKLATERVRFALTLQPEGRAELRLSFSDRRLAELVESQAERGSIDPTLLKALLSEAEFALDEVQALPEERFQLFLTKLDRSNTQHRTALEQLTRRAAEDDVRLLSEAISVCEERQRWIGCSRDAIDSGETVNRRWGSGCRCQ